MPHLLQSSLLCLNTLFSCNFITGFAQTLLFEAVGFGCLGSIALMLAMLIGSWITEGYSWVAACTMH